MMRGIFLLGLLLVISLAAPEWAGTAGEEDAPKISNVRVEGLKTTDNISVPASEVGREYRVLMDFESKAPIARLFLQPHWADTRLVETIQRPFEVTPRGALKGTLVIPSGILRYPAPASTDWWVEDANGRVSNKLTQRLVIRYFFLIPVPRGWDSESP